MIDRRQPHHHHVKGTPEWHRKRHRKFQIGITLGITSSVVLAVIVPDLSVHCAIVGLIANYAWIWEA